MVIVINNIGEDNNIEEKINKRWEDIQNETGVLFSTLPGKILENEFDDLINYFFIDSINTIAFMHSDIIGNLFNIEKDLKTNIVNLLFNDNIVKSLQHVNSDKFYNLKKQLLKILGEIEKYLKSCTPEIEDFFQDYFKLLYVGDDMELDPEKIENQIEIVEETSYEDYKNLNPVQRKISYFIYSFYTIIEMYTNSILKMSLNFVPDDRIYELFTSIKHEISTPINKIRVIKRNLKQFNPKIIAIFEDVMTKQNLHPHHKALVKLKEMRDYIGHKRNFLDIGQVLEEDAFSYFLKNVDKEIDKEIDKIKGSYFIFISDLFENLTDKLKPMFFIHEVTKKIINYLALFDYILYLYDQIEEDELIDW